MFFQINWMELQSDFFFVVFRVFCFCHTEVWLSFVCFLFCTLESRQRWLKKIGWGSVQIFVEKLQKYSLFFVYFFYKFWKKRLLLCVCEMVRGLCWLPWKISAGTYCMRLFIYKHYRRMWMDEFCVSVQLFFFSLIKNIWFLFLRCKEYLGVYLMCAFCLFVIDILVCGFPAFFFYYFAIIYHFC